DSWLLWHLTDREVHATDATNASRTMLLNLHDLQWDPEMLELFDIPEVMLPQVKNTADDFGVTSKKVFGAEIPITAMAGDQHAALYGQACFKNGQIKCTYGTGAFVLANKGTTPPIPSFDGNDAGLVATLGFRIGSKKTYVTEGSVFVTGATVQWLRDGLGVISNAPETVDLATSAGSNEGVYFVPAFVGLGAPHWQPDATGSITGLTRGSDRSHIVRAALESTAYQVKDVVDVMETGRTRSKQPIRADGGQSDNPFVMQFQADILDRPVEVANIAQTTALGAAFLAGRGVGMWRSDSEIESLWKASAIYEPSMSESERNSLYSGWLEAIRKTVPRF
ncbi:MAG: glycerol kinase, partial [Chloroflexi bacterium]|nr:glycerol kinase [Chloroflexota bacterium]